MSRKFQHIPADLFLKCPQCKRILIAKDVEKNFQVCPRCDYHFLLSYKERLQSLVDEGSFVEYDADLLSNDPLQFPQYQEKLATARAKTGLNDAIIYGTASIDSLPCVLIITDFNFMGGSMGWVLGEKVKRAMELAIEKKLPVVLISGSGGGARMQEGIISLMQMAKTAAAVGRLHSAGLPYIVVLTNPTMAGVLASFASLGDVNIAEPGALIGFTGPRVIEQTLKIKLPPDFQSSEFQLKHGFLDLVVHRKELRSIIIRLLRFFLNRNQPREKPLLVQPSLTPEDISLLPEFERPIAEVMLQLDKLEKLAEREKMDRSEEIEELRKRAEELTRKAYQNLTRWERVQVARHPLRPYTLDYAEMIFDDFIELHGDRLMGDDPAIVGGLASLQGETVVFIGHQKGRTTKERRWRNFGSARPEGYHKALRLMKMAEKFGFPVLTFLDTPGAACLTEAEERGIAQAIARNLQEMSKLKTQIIVTVIGEGGSGGAIGIGVGDRLLMQENAYYSVISPESCAAIIWRDSKRAPEAAEALKLTAQDLKNLGVADEIVPEPEGGAHRNWLESARLLKESLLRNLEELKNIPIDELIEKRYEKYNKIR
ncbi:acetyl-CoA carboxylase carboxyltransferase subunit alpha [bacterium]|nr:acetyl-CoA carboxylase carboxyltransferase subunit alpha [bacterium]